MIGIDRDTGATVDDWPAFVQRATRALTTPLGTRQKRPLYGCRLPTRLGKNLGDRLLILAQSDAGHQLLRLLGLPEDARRAHEHHDHDDEEAGLKRCSVPLVLCCSTPLEQR